MKKVLMTLALLLLSMVCFAQTTATDKATLSLSDIEKVFGTGFAAESPSVLGAIETTRFRGKDYTIHISVSPNFEMKLDDYHNMMSPKTIVWTVIPDDADGAKIEVRPDGADDLASTPAIAYMRKDKYVRIQILGNYYGYDSEKMPAAREEMRKKLALLKRIP